MNTCPTSLVNNNPNPNNNGNDGVISRFLALESAAGIILMLAAIVALVVANSPLQQAYNQLLDISVSVRAGSFDITKPLLLWVNDGFMALFFLVVGLELKREFLTGELRQPSAVMLPAIGAIGGMVVPALIYTAFNWQSSTYMSGWAIPTATDIAFCLGILALLGSRVPLGLKVFLTSLAIFDDLGAIVIIALFYTNKLSFTALAVAAGCVAVLAYINHKNVSQTSVYACVGLVLWVALLKSGVHATLAGVIVALFIPATTVSGQSTSLLEQLEHNLHTTVAFIVLPIFAFCNAGVGLINMSLSQVNHSVTLGIALGLLLGKPIGIMLFCWLAKVSKIAVLPKRVNWSIMFGGSILCGVGFTMSLFIGSLAFAHSRSSMMVDERIGILLGSILAGVVGYVVLQRALPSTKP